MCGWGGGPNEAGNYFAARLREAEARRPTRCTYDAGPGATPRVGDGLRTVRGVTYRIVAVRRVRSRVSASRWSLAMVRGEGALPGGRWLSLRWHPRGRKRRLDLLGGRR